MVMAHPLQAQLVSVKSELSTDSLMIGDQVIYTLRVEVADQVEFKMPLLGETLGKNLELLSPTVSDTTNAEGRRMVSQSYIITGFEAGMQMVPAQEVIYQSGNLIDTARSMPLMIQVYDILGREVVVLFNGTLEAGYQSLTWHSNVASGIYFIKAQNRSGWSETRKVLQVR